jgi:SpoIID/LytB domain protein
MKRLLPICLLIIIIACVPMASSQADELDDTTHDLLQKQDQLKNAQSALQQAKDQVQALSGNLPSLQSSLSIAIAEVNVKQAQLDATAAQLSQQSAQLKQQQQERATRIRELYKQDKKNAISPMLSLVDSADFRTWARLVTYHQLSLNDDRHRISNLGDQVAKLTQNRAQLQTESEDLVKQKAQFQTQVTNLRNQIALAQSQQSSANSQIANINKDIKGLTGKQQQILAAKAAANAVSTTIGDVPPATTTMPAPSFSGDAYGFASYGAPHRVGMNQYGAYGRAKAGQSFQTILTTYFSGVQLASYGVPDTINVEGYGPISFEDNYLKGISEMPRSWPLEALKAQAVAARTYAVKWIQDHPGQAICTTEACQVYDGGRINGTGSDDLQWYAAVAQTRGLVLTSGGNPISAWFSSTDGGYTQSSAQVWGGVTSYTHVVQDYAGSWPSGAYDKDSPWFHKAWGQTNGSPWLSKTDILHILNAAIVYQNTNDASSIAADLNTFTSPLTDLTGFSFTQNGGTGQTDAVLVLGTNQGIATIKANAVSAAVNLKAPGTIELKSTLFDIITR